MENRGAHFNHNRSHRYYLWRIWDESKPLVMFIGLNPSTADAEDDDPTIRRVKRFAKDWGFGGVYMVNLFSCVTSDPSRITKTNDEILYNMRFVVKVWDKCKLVVFAWGNFKQATQVSKTYISMFPGAMVLDFNKNGTPKHPLYVKADINPRIYVELND